jgi:NTE family protein
MSGSAAPTKRINLALQGGGALGAFTWGALDRLLEEQRIEIAAVSGASSGAMNAVVFASGFAAGGRKGARDALRSFWQAVANAGAASPYRRPAWLAMFGDVAPWARASLSAWSVWADVMTRVASPYELNPLNLNPLRDILRNAVDFERLRACEELGLFVSATNVETGRIRVFSRPEIDVDHVIASGCLPLLYQAVEIDGTPYWDGGYMGNPPLFPLFDGSGAASCDIFIVQLNPIERKGAPRTSPDIVARINEITFNASLLRELRAIDFVARLLDEGRLDPTRYKRVLVHVLSDDAALAQHVDADMNTDFAFFAKLHGLGRRACSAWLRRHFDDLGQRSTVDLRAMFQGEHG